MVVVVSGALLPPLLRLEAFFLACQTTVHFIFSATPFIQGEMCSNDTFTFIEMFFDHTVDELTSFGGCGSSELEPAKSLLVRLDKQLNDTTPGGEHFNGCDDSASPPVSSDETDFTHHERDIARSARRLTASGYVSPEEEELFKRVSARLTTRFKLLFDKIKSKSRVFKPELKNSEEAHLGPVHRASWHLRVPLCLLLRICAGKTVNMGVVLPT